MIYFKTDEEIEYIRQSCLLVSKTLAHVGSILKPGITGLQIDKEAEEFIRGHEGAIPGFKGYHDFPATLCVSKNEVVVHGIPDDVPFKETDIVSVDCGVYWNEFYGDAAYTFAFQGISDEVRKLLVVTKDSLYKGIEKAIPGNRIGDISHAVQSFAEKDNGYGIVRELVGHGIGRNLHESPEVPNYGSRGRGTKLQTGLVIAIEPMVNLGTKRVAQGDDGWTIRTKDRKQSAHYEHTIAVKEDGPDILSTHEYVEEAIKNNEYLSEIE